MMSLANKLAAGSIFPSIAFPTVGGPTVDLSAEPGWRLLVIYRGKHCPLCKKYLRALDNMLDLLAAESVSVFALSSDSLEKASSDVAAEGWKFKVGYAMTMDQMHSLGLYISQPRSPQEADQPFAEPGLFAINPDGRTQIIDISNAPFSRPELSGILAGIRLIKEKSYPIRGTLT